MRKKYAAFLALVLAISLFMTGCGRGSEYYDGTVSVPSTYAAYTVGPMEFRFEAGYKSVNWDEFTVESDETAALSGLANNLAVFTRLQSPIMDQGTVNYLDFGYFEMGRSVTAADLEAIMNKIDDMATDMKKMDVTSDELQSARIRAYGDDEIEAMTCCYEVDYFVDQWTIGVILQVALVPHESRVYMICYADFTSGQDDNHLEQLLSSLKFVDNTESK